MSILAYRKTYVVALWTLVVACLPASSGLAGEYHGGGQSTCSDCHVMHATKDNVPWIVTEPLLKSAAGETPLCLSCHDGSDSSAPDIVASGTESNPTSVVVTSYTSKFGSSAGYFQSDTTTTHSELGHSLYSVGSATAPLSNTYVKTGPLVCSDCHDPHGSPNYRNLLSDPNPSHPGSVSILTGVNVSETTPVNSTTPNAAAAYDTANIGFYTNNNFRAWCTDCHDSILQELPGGSPAHYMRHPSDAAFSANSHVNVSNWTIGAVGQDTGFGLDVGDGAAGIPRVRFGSATGSAAVAAAGDTVFCLSCHKAHGSKYKAGTVWPLSAVGPDSLSGCQQCHAK
ncbi:MAG: cytochrome c3 family protein [Armatimonadota bacterium]|nr:cytochrome c3 family protein [Armatimonadota bacterium]